MNVFPVPGCERRFVVLWTDRSVRLPEPYIIYRCQENGIGLVVCGTLSEKGYLLVCYTASSGDSLPTFWGNIGYTSKGQESVKNYHY